MIIITRYLSIPEHEIQFTSSRSSGPGGQNVNKVNTKVTLHFPVWASRHLTDDQKSRIVSRLKTRVTKEGVLYLHAQRLRSQAANRADLLDRFTLLLRGVLTPRKARKTTSVPRASVQHRLDQKKRHGRLKKVRQRPRKLEE